MKKAKFLSAFLSLTLSMTSFAAVPVTSYAAENDPTSVTVTTTATAPIMTTTAADIGQMADYQAKVKFSFIDNHTYIPVERLDVKLIDSSGNEVLSFNTTETPEIMADISYRASSSTSARYTLEVNGITRQYKPNNNFPVYLSPINNGTTLDYTIRLEHTTDTGYSSPYIPDDPSFCFNTTTFYRDMGDNIVIPFSNTDDADVSASIDNQDIEIVSVSTKNIILKASESGSGVLTVESENGRKITADIIIRSASNPVTGTGTTTKPVTTTTTTTSATNELFHCSSCDRDVPWDERVSGPLGVEVCRECYETKHIYLGTTTSPYIVTGTTTSPVKTTSTTTATTTAIESGIKDCTAKVKFAFIDQLSGIPISGLDVTVSKDGTELFKFNTTDTPEIVKEINYSADMNTSAIYTLEIKGLPEKYGYENNAIKRSLCLDASNNGKIVDNTLIIASIDMGYTDQVVLEDPTFGFYKKVFYLKTDSEKIIPFSNTDNVKVTATLDTTEAEIIETTEKYVILKADNSCSGTLTVTDENGRSIITKFQITKPKEYTTGTMTTTVPGRTTTTTTTTTADTPVKGDSNCDGQVSMADAVIIMQSIANPDKYGINGTEKTRITEQGQKNADIVGNSDGLTTADALAVQKIMLKLN